jgi:hypothetical protein
VSRATDELIATLAADAKPVKRLAPPGRRATVWLAVILGLGALAVASLADIGGFVARNDSVHAALAWCGSLTTGVAAVVAAAHLSLPDRPRRWALFPLPFLLLWLGASGAGCLGLPAASLGASDHCFGFILVTGGAFSAFLFWRLRRARPLDGGLTATVAALGAAGLSAALLAFFHSFTVTWLDLGAHLAAVGLILAAGALGGRRAVGGGR